MAVKTRIVMVMDVFNMKKNLFCSSVDPGMRKCYVWSVLVYGFEL